MEKAADVLRGWAEATAQSLLDAEGGEGERGRLRHLKLRPSGGSMRSRLRLTHWALKPMKLRDDTVRIQHPISLLILAHVKASQSMWPARLPRPSALFEPYWPPSLWNAIAGMAWREPRFQRRVATVVFEHFRRTEPMPGGEWPAPVLRQEVWWLLVGLVGAPEMERPPTHHRLLAALWRFWYRGSRGGRLQQRLSEIAWTEALATAGWAGFWEQWMVGEAMLHRHREIARAPEQLRQVLSQLPLLARHRYRATRNELALAATDDMATVGPRIVDPEWERQMPGWFQDDATATDRASKLS